MHFNTKLLHGGGTAAGEWDTSGATLPAIHQSSAFASPSAEQLEKIFNYRAPGFSYTRIANPTVLAFEKRMADIEGGSDAVACSSGMAAVALALLNLVQSGDEIISSGSLFGGTLDLFDDLRAFGVKTHMVEKMTATNLEPLFNSRTKAVFAEIIGNPRLDVIDIAEVAEIAHRHSLPLIIDNTTATPALIRPIEHGADIVVHSSSKYINGSSNAISGVIVDSGQFVWDFDQHPVLSKYKKSGKYAFAARLRQDLWRNFGACLAPQNAYLNCLGLETLGLRMERLCANARALAAVLEHIPGVKEVNYPGLESSPYYPLIRRQMQDAMGGAILSMRMGSKERAFSFINRLHYAHIASNIGDVRTLVLHPASTIYAHASEAVKLSAGVYDDLIRISAGIEDIEDLIEDFIQAAKLG